ncbi:MAG: hypothetical protein Athens101428_393 [Candidatus Berkelbacteria bacterium Athens1014_28]|uniref:Methylated-DNA-[protein]-cysteine S-methyltransferase DNA binding domain-containing protein n=1 Tax=Candidatus Berkelbacteria bacterium Athens1014_28 TaxID=2017145 RepID=A0A554LMY3_9BACT|nr:MAG: hypothetical protein Athens101428_393 [Candidatus Berkelbacteria bacterium Athens1014_28]
MAYKKKSWREKLEEKKDLPKVVVLDDEAARKWGGKKLAIPAPLEVDNLMKKVPKGKLQTINTIRAKVAKKHNSDIGCPICCGIFSVIAANVAAEEIAEGKHQVTSFWRTLKSNGELNPKYPDGVEFQADRLKEEGFEIDRSRKVPRVKDFEKYLV